MTDTLTLCAQIAAWRERAACRGVNVNVFFPLDDRRELTQYALTYCARCPVVVECLEDALATPVTDDHGIRGGATQAERQRIRIARRNFANRATRKVA